MGIHVGLRWSWGLHVRHLIVDSDCLEVGAGPNFKLAGVYGGRLVFNYDKNSLA